MHLFNHWTAFFEKLFLHDENLSLYLKGGSVIGIYLLKNINFNLYDAFNQLNLINDYDFILESSDPMVNQLGKEFGIFLYVNTLKLQILRRYDSNLIELSICKKDDQLELPMTAMKCKITNDNYKLFLLFLYKLKYKFLTKEDLKFLKDIYIHIPEHKNGIFINIESNIYLSNDIKNIINHITTNKNEKQCLYHLVQNPSHLSRLKWKNWDKSNKIKAFYHLYLNDLPSWLLNDTIINLVDDFILHLNYLITNIYNKYKNDIMHYINIINIYEYDYSQCHDDRVKNSIVINAKEPRHQLTLLYEEFFTQLAFIFNGMHVIRWKDNIHIYRKLNNNDALACITNLFSFNIKIKMTFNKVYDVITNKKILYENDIWLLFLELERTNAQMHKRTNAQTHKTKMITK